MNLRHALLAAIVLLCLSTVVLSGIRLGSRLALQHAAEAELRAWSALERDLTARRSELPVFAIGSPPRTDLAVALLAAVRAAGLPDDTLAEVTPQDASPAMSAEGGADGAVSGFAWYRRTTAVRLRPLDLPEIGLLLDRIRAELPHVRVSQLDLQTQARPHDPVARYTLTARLSVYTLDAR